MTYTLHHGDCLEVMRTLPDASVDAVVTSPPYAMQRAKQYGGIPETEYPAWTVAWMHEARRILKPTGSVLINIREHVKDGQISDYVHHTRLALRADRWIECDELIWIKPSAPPVGHPKRPRRSWERVLWFSPSRRPWCDAKANGSPSSLIGMTGGQPEWVQCVTRGRVGIARSKDYVSIPTGHNPQGIKHPAMYPADLATWMLQLITPPDGTILDPFLGSGTTGVAAVQTGRSFIGIERDASYFEIAQTRIASAHQESL